MKRLLLLILMSLISVKGFAHDDNDKTVVRVGGYEFPPFVEFEGGDFSGATIDLIQIFNQLQSRITFALAPTSPKRRYRDLSEKRYDIIMFENKAWGWRNYSVTPSKVFMRGGEVYIALNKQGRDQTFFDDIASRHIVGILGYHYGFANFNADEEYLSKNFTIFLSNDHLRNIELILLDRAKLAEVAVVTQAFLTRVFKQKPMLKDRLLVSEKYDQTYQHTILVSDDQSKISVAEINQLLDLAESSGELDKLRKRYGIDDDAPLEFKTTTLTNSKK